MIWRVFFNSISFLISDAQNKFWSTFTSMEKNVQYYVELCNKNDF